MTIFRKGKKFFTKLISLFKNRIYDFIPIKRHEITKFLLITLLLFCILFIQNITKSTKDGLVSTLVATEIMPFLKVWGTLPAAFLFSLFYIKLTNIFSAEKIFYIIISGFLIFFLLFAFFLFPKEYAANAVLRQSGIKLSLMDSIIRNWSSCIFYIISDSWSNVACALLFWQFVNNITSVEQSVRFYMIFGLLGQTGLFFSGIILSNIEVLINFLKLKIKIYNYG